MIYIITFPRFESVVAQGLTSDEVRRIKTIKESMSSDEDAGYCSEEQRKMGDILDIVRNKIVSAARI